MVTVRLGYGESEFEVVRFEKPPTGTAEILQTSGLLAGCEYRNLTSSLLARRYVFVEHLSLGPPALPIYVYLLPRIIIF